VQRFLCHIILIVVCGTLGYAQTGTVKFDRISLENGLSQSTVNAIAQDGLGFLWFGTQDGLNRYDGYGVTVFKHNVRDTQSVSDNGIWSLCRDHDGDLWIGTMRGGLSRYNITTGRFHQYRTSVGDTTSISDDNVTSVFQDSRGVIWAGTLTGGLNRLDPASGRVHRYQFDPADSASLADNTVWTVAEDSAGTLWIATWGGLCRFIPPAVRADGAHAHGSFVRYKRGAAASSPGSNNIRTLMVDRKGMIWVGTWGRGLDRLEPHTGTFTHYTHSVSDGRSLSSNLILSLHEDRNGAIWVGTGDAGLNLLDPVSGTVRHFAPDPSSPVALNNGIICSLIEDSAGTLWIGTGAGGVNRYDRMKNRFDHYRDNENDPDDLAGNDVWTLLEDHNGVLWIGTYGSGLNRFDRKTNTFTHYVHVPGRTHTISHNNVISLCETRAGVLYCGTEGGGLNRFDNRTGEFFQYRHDPRDPSSLAQDEVTVLLEDRHGVLWIGTNGSGLDRMEPATGRITHFAPDEKDARALPAGSILALLEDRQGDLWVGMYGGGAARIETSTGTITRYPFEQAQPGGINNSTVLSFYEEPSGIMWIGTYGGGLNRFDRSTGSWQYITEQQGLPNDVIYGIMPDARGNLWLPTNKGLARYTYATGSIKVFDMTDGLQGNEFNQGAHTRTRGGEFLLGGINGFNAFFPDSIADNRFVPPVYLTSFRVFDKEVGLPAALSVTRAIELTHDRNFLSFEFVALNYTSPGKNRYAYMLEGLDGNWIEAGTRRYVSYTNLDPGHYVLRVRGSNNDGVWNTAGTALSITIVPPYWRTWWFQVLAVGTIAAILFFMYRYRVNKLLEIERIRTSIASDLHDDIGSTLTEIALYSDVGLRSLRQHHDGAALSEEERTKLLSLLGEIGTTSRSLIDAMNDIVWSIDPRNDSFEFLLVRIRMHATKMLEAKGINYEIDIPGGLASLRFPLGSRRRLFLIYKEAINNALRHAQATRVALTLKREGRLLVMSIVDNGTGFDPGSGSRGNGLHNMQSRARSIGGELSIMSAPGLGTTVTLRVGIP
jgi:ligand-binding sensor domain-containing protein